MNVRTMFRFTLPKGTGIKTEEGRKASGMMRLIQVKDVVEIQRDSSVQKDSGGFYISLLTKTVKELGLETGITKKTIENLNPVDFSFLVDFMHEINHQVIKKVPLTCESCGHSYMGEFAPLGEA
jgi:predicted RNA-binding protein YlxR (DUF448 family)